MCLTSYFLNPPFDLGTKLGMPHYDWSNLIISNIAQIDIILTFSKNKSNNTLYLFLIYYCLYLDLLNYNDLWSVQNFLYFLYWVVQIL